MGRSGFMKDLDASTDMPRIYGLLGPIFRLGEARRNEMMEITQGIPRRAREPRSALRSRSLVSPYRQLDCVDLPLFADWYAVA